MRELVVKQPVELAQVIALDVGVYNIGRKEGLEIVVADETVSRNHAKLSVEETQVFIDDLGSLHGTKVNGEEIKESRLLRNGDTIMIGLVLMSFIAPNESDISLVDKDDDSTKVFSPEELKAVLEGEVLGNTETCDEINDQTTVFSTERLNELVASEIDKNVENTGSRQSAVALDGECDQNNTLIINTEELSVLTTKSFKIVLLDIDEEECSFNLKEGRNTIGRDSCCDIQLIDMSLSRFHANIYVDKSGENYIEDCNSTNGTEVNGVPCVQKITLTPGDVVKLGDLKLQYVDNEYKRSGNENFVKNVKEKFLRNYPILWGRFKETSAQIYKKINVDKFKTTSIAKIAYFRQLDFSRKKYLTLTCAILCLFLFVTISLYLFKGKNPLTDGQNRVSGSDVNQDNSQGNLLDSGVADNLNVFFQSALDNIEKRRWIDARTQLLEIGRLNADYPGLSVKMQFVEYEIDNNNKFIQGNSFFQEGLYKNGLDAFSQIDSKSIYYTEAQDNIARIESRISKMNNRQEQQNEQLNKDNDFIRFENLFSEAQEKAITLYNNGKIDDAISVIDEFVTTYPAFNETQQIKKMIQLSTGMASIRDQYLESSSLLEQKNDKDAYAIWDSILLEEERLLGTTENYFSQKIHEHLAKDDFVIAQNSFKRGDFVKASKYCSKILSESPGHTGALTLKAQLNDRAKDVFEKGYILEDLNYKKAVELWEGILKTCPADCEYYIKAQNAISKYK